MPDKLNLNSDEAHNTEFGKLLIKLDGANENHKTIKDLGTLLSAPVNSLRTPLYISKLINLRSKARLLAVIITLAFFLFLAAVVFVR